MTPRPCQHCARPSTARTCSACETAKRRGRLEARLEVLREKAARGMGEKPKPAPVVRELRPGALVVLKSEPPCEGRVMRREREGWMVWFSGWGECKCHTRELRVIG